MANRRRNGAQALPVNRRKAPPALQEVSKNVVSAAEQSVTGFRRDFLRYVDFHPALYILTGVAIIALVCIIYLSQVTAVTNANYSLQAEQTEHTKLIQQKEDLLLAIARAQSLPNIEKQARERLHMVPIDDHYEYIVIPPGVIQGLNPNPTPAPAASQP